VENKIDIIDNFLSLEHFESLEKIFFDIRFPWFYNSSINYLDRDGERISDEDGSRELEEYNFQFTHVLYGSKPDDCHQTINSKSFDTIIPILEKLNPKSLVRAKVNLIPRADKIIIHGFHNDFKDYDSTTALFYINTNNGLTVFENGKECSSVSNRLVMFPSSLKHSGTTCTDEKIRVTLNINYF